MATLVLEEPVAPDQIEQPAPAKGAQDAGLWLVFRYAPIALFSLKSSRATSTAGKTLLTPTPYAIKMGFLDAVLRHDLTRDPQSLVQWLAAASLRIGVPRHACVTGTIQSVRQETRKEERKRNLPPYRATIAMREFVHYQGTLSVAFDLETCARPLVELLLQAAPAINYLGKRGSFIQYLSHESQTGLDSTFTQPVDDGDNTRLASGQRTILDDFGTKASFDALNSFSTAEVVRGVHRKFVETVIPFDAYNTGPGFVHYRSPGAMI